MLRVLKEHTVLETDKGKPYLWLKWHRKRVHYPIISLNPMKQSSKNL